MLLNTKLKMLSVLSTVAVLAACTTTPVQPNPSQPVVESFSCTDNSRIDVKYLPEQDQAMLTATVPKVSWSNQYVVMNLAPSASGMRYLNQASPNVSYEWHAKGSEGILGMTWTTGEQYQIMCHKVQ